MLNPMLSTKKLFCGKKIGTIDRPNYLFDDVHPYRFRPTEEHSVSILSSRISMELINE